MQPPDCVIRARSRRQAMDWALVLASQGIEATITRPEDGGWALLVDARDATPAFGALRQYQIENRGWQWRQTMPISGLVFHTGCLLWAGAMIASYYICETRFPRLEDLGIIDSNAVRAGQWWRLFTAVTLHENLPHLAANLTSGCLFLGLAMARFGAGVALLAAFLAGAAGNLAGIYCYEEHRALGASGMVMAALGLLAAASFGEWRAGEKLGGMVWRAGAAAALILVLFGFSPETDVVAHVGGFLAGALCGALLSLARPEALQKGFINAAATVALIVLALGTWFLAA